MKELKTNKNTGKGISLTTATEIILDEANLGKVIHEENSARERERRKSAADQTGEGQLPLVKR